MLRLPEKEMKPATGEGVPVVDCGNCRDKERCIEQMQSHINTLERELHRCQSMYDDLKEEARQNKNCDSG